jgi:hypothetical protein
MLPLSLLLPSTDTQAYTYDADLEDEKSRGSGHNVNAALALQLRQTLQEHNPYAQQFRTTWDDAAEDLFLLFRAPRKGNRKDPDSWLDKHRYNVPEQRRGPPVEIAQLLKVQILVAGSLLLNPNICTVTAVPSLPESTLIQTPSHRSHVSFLPIHPPRESTVIHTPYHRSPFSFLPIPPLQDPQYALDIIVSKKRTTPSLLRVPFYNASTDPLLFPVLFPCGDSGYQPKLQRTTPRTRHVNLAIPEEAAQRLWQQENVDNDTAAAPAAADDEAEEAAPAEDKMEETDSNRKIHYVTVREFYAHRLQDRINQPGNNLLLSGRRLLQEYIVQAYVKQESDRLM